MNWLRFLQLFLMWFPACAMFVAVAFICECVWQGIEQKRRIHELARVVREWGDGRKVVCQEDGALASSGIEASRGELSRSTRSGL